jgi:hypothetical protein
VYQQASPVALCQDLAEAGFLHPFKLENREDPEEYHRVLASSLCPTEAAVEAIKLLGEPKVVADAVIRLHERAQREVDAALSQEEQIAWVERAYAVYPQAIPVGYARRNDIAPLSLISNARIRLRKSALDLKDALYAFDGMRRAVAAGDGLPEPRSVADLIHDALAGDAKAAAELRLNLGAQGLTARVQGY